MGEKQGRFEALPWSHSQNPTPLRPSFDAIAYLAPRDTGSSYIIWWTVPANARRCQRAHFAIGSHAHFVGTKRCACVCVRAWRVEGGVGREGGRRKRLCLTITAVDEVKGRRRGDRVVSDRRGNSQVRILRRAALCQDFERSKTPTIPHESAPKSTEPVAVGSLGRGRNCGLCNPMYEKWPS